MGRGKTPAVLLLGSDVFWRDRCREKLVEACIPEGARDWGVARFSAAEVPLGRILHQAQTVPMLVPRQVVFVEEADVLDAAGEEEGEEKRGEKRGKERGKERDKTLRELAAYLDDPAPFTLMVFEASRLD